MVDVAGAVGLVVGAPGFVVVVEAAGTDRFGAACAGDAASVAPKIESRAVDAKRPTARVAKERLFTAPPLLQGRLQAALPQGAVQLFESPQLHRQGPPRTKAT